MRGDIPWLTCAYLMASRGKTTIILSPRASPQS